MVSNIDTTTGQGKIDVQAELLVACGKDKCHIW